MAVRCSAPDRAPQRTPKAPNTPWGRLRKPTGWSLRDLAEQTGVNSGVLSRIERGMGPTPEQAWRLAAVYGHNPRVRGDVGRGLDRHDCVAMNCPLYRAEVDPPRGRGR